MAKTKQETLKKILESRRDLYLQPTHKQFPPVIVNKRASSSEGDRTTCMQFLTHGNENARENERKEVRFVSVSSTVVVRKQTSAEQLERRPVERVTMNYWQALRTTVRLTRHC